MQTTDRPRAAWWRRWGRASAAGVGPPTVIDTDIGGYQGDAAIATAADGDVAHVYVDLTETWLPQQQDDGRWVFLSTHDYDLAIRARPSGASYLVDQYGGSIGGWKRFEVAVP